MQGPDFRRSSFRPFSSVSLLSARRHQFGEALPYPAAALVKCVAEIAFRASAYRA